MTEQSKPATPQLGTCQEFYHIAHRFGKAPHPRQHTCVNWKPVETAAQEKPAAPTDRTDAQKVPLCWQIRSGRKLYVFAKEPKVEAVYEYSGQKFSEIVMDETTDVAAPVVSGAGSAGTAYPTCPTCQGALRETQYINVGDVAWRSAWQCTNSDCEDCTNYNLIGDSEISSLRAELAHMVNECDKAIEINREQRVELNSVRSDYGSLMRGFSNLEDKVAELRAENERLAKTLAASRLACIVSEERVEKAELALSQSQEALRKYGDHSSDCLKCSESDCDTCLNVECTCGFEAALSAVPAKEKTNG